MAAFEIEDAENIPDVLIARAERGEDVVITRGGNPVANLVPVESSKRRPTFG